MGASEYEDTEVYFSLFLCLSINFSCLYLPGYFWAPKCFLWSCVWQFGASISLPVYQWRYILQFIKWLSVRNHFICLNLQAIHQEILLWCFAKWVACFLSEEKPLLCLLTPVTKPQYFKQSALYCYPVLLPLHPDLWLKQVSFPPPSEMWTVTNWTSIYVLHFILWTL